MRSLRESPTVPVWLFLVWVLTLMCIQLLGRHERERRSQGLSYEMLVDAR
jgi:hypothetical protein